MTFETKAVLVHTSVVYNDTDAVFRTLKTLFREKKKRLLSRHTFQTRRRHYSWGDYQKWRGDASVRALQDAFLWHFDDRECFLTPSILDILETFRARRVKCVILGMQDENRIASKLASFGIASYFDRIVGDVKGTEEEVATKIQWVCDSMDSPFSSRYACVVGRTYGEALSAEMVCARPLVFAPDSVPEFGCRYTQIHCMMELLHSV